MRTKTKKAIGLSVVSLFACFATQTILATNTNVNKIASQTLTTKATKKVKKHKATNYTKETAQTKQASLQKQTANASQPQIIHTKNSSTANIQPFVLQPRLNIWGYTGDFTLAQGQFMVPIFGDTKKVFYGLAEGNMVKKDSTWVGGAGFGYRQIANNKIWGGYAKFDYTGTAERQNFWIANPGLEMLGQIWDARISGYFPIGPDKVLGDEDWADQLGIYDHVHFTGHDEYDDKLKLYEEAGRGFDAEVGRVIPYIEDAKFFVGGYHFDTDDAGSINGATARLTYDINKYVTLEAKESYDDTNFNTFLVGVRFSIGGYSKDEKKDYGISSRLMDPIENNLAGNMVIPVKDKYVDIGKGLEHDNLWFYQPSEDEDSGIQEGSGTFEDPFIGFTEDNYNVVVANQGIGVIDPNPLLYFAPGEYSFSEFSDQGQTDRFNLPNGWGMYGRTDDYVMPAEDDERAIFYGGLDLNYNEGAGSATTTIDSIKVIYNSTVGSSDANEPTTTIPFAALYINNADNVIINNANAQTNTRGCLQLDVIN